MLAAIASFTADMTTTEIISLASAVVAAGSMIAAIASAWSARKNARIAEQAKEQALKAAALERRAKAIDHLRKALGDINDNQVRGETVNNVRDAMQLSELVFNKFRAPLILVHDHTQSLHQQIMAHAEKHHPGPTPPNEQLLAETRALGEELEKLIARMKQEAALG